MPKFLIDVEIDGYDTVEEMLENINEAVVEEALEYYGFLIIDVKKVEE
jgi:hypothetical protein